MLRKLMFSLAAAVAGIVAATPALASTIIYTIKGNLSGQYYPSALPGTSVAFDAPVTIVGSANTITDYFALPFDPPVTGIVLHNVTFSSTLGTSGTSIFALASTPSPGVLGLVSFETVPLTFSSAALQSYDIRTAIGETPVVWDGTPGEFSYKNGFVDYTNATNLTFSAALAGAVPEPATWAMMIIGFGVVGGAMRRRLAARPLLV